MPDLWMRGAEVHDLGDHAPTDQQYPPKAIAHITWDRNATAAAPQDWCDFDDLVSYFTGSGRASAPHLIWDPFTGRIAQLYPATSRSKSVADGPGGTRTNRAGRVVIQIEAVFFPYCRYQGRVYPRLVDTPCAGWDRLHAWIASWGVPDAWPMGRPTDFTSRRDERTWETTGGWYAHAHVPENDHQDPGSWPGFTTTSTAPSAEEDDMTPEQMLAARLGSQYTTPEGFTPTVADALNGAAYATQQATAAVAAVEKLRADLPQLLLTTLLPEYAALPDGYRPTLAEALNGSKQADYKLTELAAVVQGVAKTVDQLKAQLTTRGPF
ncbi:hypothetical protein [Kitasatospora sp. NPDC127116]|uniref:hypothetical protein n=1 Tax=Kitasatospora sp. NPDC127116 TaxID=3345367 RepID=UPI003640962B